MVKYNYNLALHEPGKGVSDSSKASLDFQMFAFLDIPANPAKLHSKAISYLMVFSTEENMTIFQRS